MKMKLVSYSTRNDLFVPSQMTLEGIPILLFILLKDV